MRLPFFAIAALFLVGCVGHDLNPVHDRIGVYLDESTVVVSYLPCAGEIINDVVLWELDGNDIAGDEGDSIIWEASSAELVAILNAPIQIQNGSGSILMTNEAEYWIFVHTNTGIGSPSTLRLTELGELGQDEVFSGGRARSVEDFEERATDSCE